MFLMDGLNFNQGDGETILEDFDIAALSHAEVFRGANAFKYGALTLGGGNQSRAVYWIRCGAISSPA